MKTHFIPKHDKKANKIIKYTRVYLYIVCICTSFVQPDLWGKRSRVGFKMIQTPKGEMEVSPVRRFEIALLHFLV